MKFYLYSKKKGFRIMIYCICKSRSELFLIFGSFPLWVFHPSPVPPPVTSYKYITGNIFLRSTGLCIQANQVHINIGKHWLQFLYQTPINRKMGIPDSEKLKKNVDRANRANDNLIWNIDNIWLISLHGNGVLASGQMKLELRQLVL